MIREGIESTENVERGFPWSFTEHPHTFFYLGLNKFY